MFKAVFFHPWPEDAEAFKRHYVEHHAPLCQAIPDSGRSSYSFIEGAGGASDWFCIFEAEFPSRAAWEASMQSPEEQAARTDATSCLRFHENERAVRTASSEQVRQPINRSGLDQWQNFEPWLGPLKEAPGPVLECYPEVPEFNRGGGD